MKLVPSTVLALAGLIFCTLNQSTIAAYLAQNSGDSASQTQTPSPTVGVTPAVFEVLKLVRAQVGDDTILAFIANSGNNYPLNAAQLIYLKNAGVSDRLLTAMLSKKAPKPTTAAAPQPAPALQQAASPSGTSEPSPSTTYVAPYPAAYTPYYDSYPYYPYYYSSYWPYYYPGYSFSVAYNWGYPYYRYPYYGHYPWHGYKPGYGHHPTPYPHGGHSGGGYRPPPKGGATHPPTGIPASSRYVGATGKGGWPQSGFYQRGTYIGATGSGLPSFASRSRGTYVGATGSAFSRPSGTYVGATGRGGFSSFSAGARMGGMPSGGGFRSAGGFHGGGGGSRGGRGGRR